jgi:hypothetical protein
MVILRCTCQSKSYCEYRAATRVNKCACFRIPSCLSVWASNTFVAATQAAQGTLRLAPPHPTLRIGPPACGTMSSKNDNLSVDGNGSTTASHQTSLYTCHNVAYYERRAAQDPKSQQENPTSRRLREKILFGQNRFRLQFFCVFRKERHCCCSHTAIFIASPRLRAAARQKPLPPLRASAIF